MKEYTGLKQILKAGKLMNELELERALILDRKLRLLIKDNPDLIESRKRLRSIINQYERANWSKESTIDDLMIKESDAAEYIAEQERIFLENRKITIRQKIDSLKITQQDLGKLLGHSKSYMSELINGISPFSIRDLVILHKLLGIKLESLLPTIISEKDKTKIKTSLSKLNKPNLNLSEEVLELLLV